MGDTALVFAWLKDKTGIFVWFSILDKETTLSQMINFRRCSKSLQTTILNLKKMIKKLLQFGRKHCWKRTNCLLPGRQHNCLFQ